MKRILESIESASEKRLILVLIALAFAIYIPLIFMKPGPTNIMETRNLITARECALDGNCLSTTMNAKPRVRKPPLPSWSAALPMIISGETSGVYYPRVPSVIATTAFLIFLFLLARLWLSKVDSFTTALVAATSFLLISEGWKATWDIYTLTFATGAMWLMCSGLMKVEGKEKVRPPVYMLALSGALWGLAFLSKWHFTAYSVVLPFVIALLFTRTFWKFKWQYLPIVLFFAAIVGLPWPILMYLEYPKSFLFSDTKASLYLKDMLFDHPFYYMRLPMYVFPWTIFFFSAVYLAISKRAKRAVGLTKDGSKTLRFFLIWAAADFVLLTLAPYRKSRYALPMLIPCTLLIAQFIGIMLKDRADAGERFRKTLGAHGFIVSGTALFVGISTVYFVFWMGMPAYLLITVPPLLAVTFYALKDKFDVSRMRTITAALIILFTFIVSVLSSTATSDFPERRAAYTERIEEIAGGGKIYILRYDERAGWSIGRTLYEVSYNFKEIEEYPAYMIMDTRSEKRLKPQAKHSRISYREVFHFFYDMDDNMAVLLELKKEEGGKDVRKQKGKVKE